MDRALLYTFRQTVNNIFQLWIKFILLLHLSYHRICRIAHLVRNSGVEQRHQPLLTLCHFIHYFLRNIFKLKDLVLAELCFDGKTVNLHVFVRLRVCFVQLVLDDFEHVIFIRFVNEVVKIFQSVKFTCFLFSIIIL